LECWPVTPEVAGSSPVHSATSRMTQQGKGAPPGAFFVARAGIAAGRGPNRVKLRGSPRPSPSPRQDAAETTRQVLQLDRQGDPDPAGRSVRLLRHGAVLHPADRYLDRAGLGPADLVGIGPVVLAGVDAVGGCGDRF